MLMRDTFLTVALFQATPWIICYVSKHAQLIFVHTHAGMVYACVLSLLRD